MLHVMLSGLIGSLCCFLLSDEGSQFPYRRSCLSLVYRSKNPESMQRVEELNWNVHNSDTIRKDWKKIPDKHERIDGMCKMIGKFIAVVIFGVPCCCLGKLDVSWSMKQFFGSCLCFCAFLTFTDGNFSLFSSKSPAALSKKQPPQQLTRVEMEMRLEANLRFYNFHLRFFSNF